MDWRGPARFCHSHSAPVSLGPLWHAENLYYQYQLGVLDEGALSGTLELAESIAHSRINGDIWEGRKHVHPQDFVASQELRRSMV